ncbi:GNAT family N-acetyltransferase [Priestia taiwanensis]|uniref:Acetyltransferase n=1 Tax=Priestia taiwanensis TaxID=1347902 RepID=A0A917ANC7_9BACI|nr:GNAT family N-acetyltransferase [Priestia taiwanensis]MBM7362335.1 GNAT superfamily N-acetyltransferase [Priestia taiwanensis]GGE61348.1 acetyltransferase [Priestia taiwanensis]
MSEFKMKKIKNLLYKDIKHVIEESKEEGFLFLERLIHDYQNDTNTFNKLGEALYGVFNREGLLVAIGGLNIDPFANRELVGRLRRYYVLKEYRRLGLGKQLLTKIIEDAKNHFHVLVLYTDTEQADKFYTSCGFTKEKKFPKSTHFLNIKESPSIDK